MKNSLIIGIVLTILGLLLILTSFIFVGFDIDKLSTTGSYIKDNQSIKYNNQDIIIDNSVVDIYFDKSKSDNIEIELYYSENDIINLTSDDNIYISAEKDDIFKHFGFNFNFRNPYIKIYLPNSYTNNLSINSDVGNIEINNINTDNIYIDSSVSDIEIDNIKSNVLNIKSDVGTIDFENCNINIVDIESNIGNIEFDDLVSTDVSFKSDIGNIDGIINGNIEDYHVTVNTDISSSNIKPTLNGIYKLNVESNIGDIDINFK